MIDSKKRKKMENLIYKVFNELDPSGVNTKKYKQIFAGMTDKQFDSFFKYLFENEDEYLRLDIVDYERDLTIEMCENAANALNIPLFEYLYMPHISMDLNNIVVSKEKVPIIYANIKRTQQCLIKKNGLSTSISTRSSLTNQVTGGDKNGRESDLENSMLMSLGAVNCLRELNGPRADDMVMQQEMITEINKKGYVSIDELTNDVANKTTLNTTDVFFIGMSIKSDLVTKGLMLKKSIE